MKPTLVQWGAGNIGRSFIGQVFSRGGYRVIFIDIDQKLVARLNDAGRYVVEAVSREGSEKWPVEGVSALHASQTDAIREAVASTDVLSVSVGKQVLGRIAGQLADAIAYRHASRPDAPLDIIIAENIHHGAEYLASLLNVRLPAGFPLERYVGLVETSIGKMVPIQDPSTPLVLRAEAYNRLIVDRDGFLGPVPSIPDLEAVSPISAYVDRKLFIHNLGHAAAAYLGYRKHPDLPLIADVLEDPEIFDQVRKTMVQSMEILLHLHPGVFTQTDLERHIDDLLMRFGNRFLGDTVFRVGRDLQRKLRYDDRIMGIIMQAQQIGMAWNRIGRVFVAALSFTCRDSDGKRWEPDDTFLRELEGLDRRSAVDKASALNASGLAPDIRDAVLSAFELIA